MAGPVRRARDHARPIRRAGKLDTRQAGQVLVVFAIAITVLLGAAGIAVDAGRFYSERRFLQNAADAGALAAGNALVHGQSQDQANAVALDTLSRNFAKDPNGVVPALPPSTPVYEAGHSGDVAYLLNGIVISGGSVRVAVLNQIQYTFGRVIGLGSTPISARAKVQFYGDMLPIAVRQFINPPGPEAGATNPCPGNPAKFTDFFATSDTSCLGSDSNNALRTTPNAGAAFDASNPNSDPANHGPIVAILGQGAQPNNGVDFRGFVALDIRDFQSSTSRSYYNGVTVNTNANTLKQMESGWVATGYPGPLFPSIVSPPDPNDQVAIMNGNSAGIVVNAMEARYVPGDEILVLVYPGNVMAIPDFALSPPGEIDLPVTGDTDASGLLKVSRNQAFSGTVTLSMAADTLDPANPGLLGTLQGPTFAAFSPNPVTPNLGAGTSVHVNDMKTSSATPGIYVMWITGQAGAPYLSVKHEPVAVKIGTVTRDFTLQTNSQAANATNTGDTVTFTVTLQNSPNKNTAFGNPVTLSIDTPTPSGVGAISFGSTTVTPTKAGASTTLSINTGTLAQGSYDFDLRGTGMNGDSTSRKVTHLVRLTVNVQPSSGSGADNYVDIAGWSVMRVATQDSNTINAYAITGVITDMSDSRLRRGQVARLVPWS